MKPEAPGRPRRLAPTLLVMAILLAAGLGCYGVFVQHILDRGDTIVDEPVESPEASGPLMAAGAGILLLIASGIAGLSPVVRGHRLAPLAGFGLPLAVAGLVGGSAFGIGKSAFTLILILLVPSLLTAGIACLVPPGPPSLTRFLLRSWMATGFLLGLALMAFGGLSLLEDVLPHLPFASVVAALAIGTLIQLAARYVARHGRDVEGLALKHQQVRHVHETVGIRAVADRLHPFIEEGRDGPDYELLTQQLGKAGGQPAIAAPVPAPGRPTLPHRLSISVAILRSVAIGLPLLVLRGELGVGAALVVAGLALPFARAILSPPEEPSRRLAWLGGSLLMAAGGVFLLFAFGLPTANAVLGAALGLPYLIILITTLRHRPVPAHLAFLRVAHARKLASRHRREAARGLVLAGGMVIATPTLWVLSFLIGIALPTLPPLALALGALSGLLWAGAAWLIGPGAELHRRGLAVEQASQAQARRTAHSLFLERLEM